MDIIEMKLNDLHPYENNPRYNDDAVEAVASSIKQFGFKVPIIIDKNNVIVTGHTRYKAAKQLGLEKVPCIKADDLTDQQIKAFRLADNKVSEIATWDMGKLNLELEEIEDIDMSDFGFDDIFNEDENTSTITSGSELDLDDFGDDKFQCTCPKCGFRFNPKE